MKLISCQCCGAVFDKDVLDFDKIATIDEDGNQKSFQVCTVCDESIWEDTVQCTGRRIK